MPENLPAEPQRKEIFLALVEAQDREITVAQSRKEVAERFGVSESHMRTIEREGLDKCWPRCDDERCGDPLARNQGRAFLPGRCGH